MATFNQNLYKAIELHFQKHNAVPTIEKLSELTSLPLETIEEAFDDEDFIQILRSSYLYDRFNSAPGDLSLTQLAAFHVFSNQHDRRTITQKLKALKITSQQFNRWMADPTFSRMLNEKVQQNFKDNGYRVFQSLLEQAAGGDFNSTKLYMEMNGHYTPTNRLNSTNVNVSVKSIDLLIEVILRVLGPLPTGQELIAQITSGFEQVLTNGTLPSVTPELLPPAEAPLPFNVVQVDPIHQASPIHQVSPVEAVGSSGKLASVVDFLDTVARSNELLEEEDDLGI